MTRSPMPCTCIWSRQVIACSVKPTACRPCGARPPALGYGAAGPDAAGRRWLGRLPRRSTDLSTRSTRPSTACAPSCTRRQGMHAALPRCGVYGSTLKCRRHDRARRIRNPPGMGHGGPVAVVWTAGGSADPGHRECERESMQRLSQGLARHIVEHRPSHPWRHRRVGFGDCTAGCDDAWGQSAAGAIPIWWHELVSCLAVVVGIAHRCWPPNDPSSSMPGGPSGRSSLMSGRPAKEL